MNVSNMLIFGLGSIVDGIMGVLASILWGLCDIFFVLINLMEELFQKFAGLDTMWTKSGEAVEGDVVLYLINTPIIWEMFLSLVVFSLFLLIILTTFAVVKNQYAEKPKPPMSFISNAIKGLLMYLMIPVCVVAGLTVGNIVLQAIDGATSVFVEEENGSASGMLYIAAAYNGNRIRLNGGDALSDLWYKLTPIHDDLNALGIYSAADAKQLDQDNEEDAKVLEKAAMLMDNAFINGELSGWLGSDIYSITAVWTYYDVFSMSLLTIWVGGAFMIWVLLGITWGLLNRIFRMVIGYCIAPVLVANYPLDDGAALKNWTKDFSKQATMAYAAVGVMNVFYSVLPFINEINILGYESIFNNLVQLFVLISGLLLVKNLIGQVAGYFGTGDALSEGLTAGKAISGKFKTGLSKATGTVAGAIGGAKEGGFRGLVSGAYKGSGAADKFDFHKPVKDFKASMDAGKAYYDEGRKNSIFFPKSRPAAYEVEKETKKSSAGLKAKFEELDKAKDSAMSGVTPGSTQAKIIENQFRAQKLQAAANDPLVQAYTAKQQKEVEEKQKQYEAVKGEYSEAENYVRALNDMNELKTEALGSFAGSKNSDAILSAAMSEDRAALTRLGLNYAEASSVMANVKLHGGQIIQSKQNISQAKKSLEDVISSDPTKRASLENVGIIDSAGNLAADVISAFKNVEAEYETLKNDMNKSKEKLQDAQLNAAELNKKGKLMEELKKRDNKELLEKVHDTLTKGKK